MYCIVMDNEEKNKIYTCIEHMHLNKEIFVSPCRGICHKCEKKTVHGHSNPDHISNPFGYLFLIPKICEECSKTHKLCAWCKLSYTDRKEN